MFAGNRLYAVLSKNALCESMVDKYDWFWGREGYAFMCRDCWKCILGTVQPWVGRDGLRRANGSMSCMVQRTMTLTIKPNLSIT